MYCKLINYSKRRRIFYYFIMEALFRACSIGVTTVTNGQSVGQTNRANHVQYESDVHLLEPFTCVARLAQYSFLTYGTRLHFVDNGIAFHESGSMIPYQQSIVRRLTNVFGSGGASQYDLSNLRQPLERYLEWYSENGDLCLMTSRAIIGLQLLGKIYRSHHYHLTADAVSYYETILQCALQKQKTSSTSPSTNNQESSSTSTTQPSSLKQQSSEKNLPTSTPLYNKYGIDIEHTADCYRGDGLSRYDSHVSSSSSSSSEVAPSSALAPNQQSSPPVSIMKDVIIASTQTQQQRTRICLDDFWKKSDLLLVKTMFEEMISNRDVMSSLDHLLRGKEDRFRQCIVQSLGML